MVTTLRTRFVCYSFVSFFGVIIFLLLYHLSHPAVLYAKENLPCLRNTTTSDAIVIADQNGQVIFGKNDKKARVPASTLKILTALTALHHLGPSYKFKTEFYLDRNQDLKVKGYGDPFLVSEVWQDISRVLAKRVQNINDLILDDTYFSGNIRIPGRGRSTNPYDAPVGGLSANFNTIFFKRDPGGRIISAETQTPLTPLARKKIESLKSKRGRYTFTHGQGEATLYAGELLSHFLKENRVKIRGDIRLGSVRPEDKLIYTYHSRFTLEEALKKMLEFSNNFVANQILIALGARLFGPPGTLNKGVRVITDYVKKELHLGDVQIVEGSGISRKNRLSALDMAVILKRFRPYRHLLKRTGRIFYKTGSLKGIRTRAGYVDGGAEGVYSFVIFLNRSGANIDALMKCIRRFLT